MNIETTLATLKEQFNLDASSKILVVGLGVTGTAVTRYLDKLGFYYAIVDSRAKPPLMADFIESHPETPVFTGGFHADAFAVASHLIVSPGIALHEIPIQNALARGAVCLSDIDLFACSVNAPIVGITGSNGKSTVTTMVGDMARQAGKKVGVGGNLGVPALDLISSEVELYVLELSSFQLERVSMLNAVASSVLNISADHLDRHADLADYARQKQAIFRGTGWIVINVDDAVVSGMQADYSGRNILTFGLKHPADFTVGTVEGIEQLMYRQQPLMPVSELPLEGGHNVANALAALAIGHAINLPFEPMCIALRKFKSLAHRMQKVAVVNDVTWINDSKATNIGACVAALDGYTRPLILLAGGDAKGADMQELVPTIRNKVKSVVLMGKDAHLIEQAIDGCVPVYRATTIQQAVKIAAGLAQTGDCVLLSPACASIDQFRDYKDRGEQFSRAVLELAS